MPWSLTPMLWCARVGSGRGRGNREQVQVEGRGRGMVHSADPIDHRWGCSELALHERGSGYMGMGRLRSVGSEMEVEGVHAMGAMRMLPLWHFRLLRGVVILGATPTPRCGDKRCVCMHDTFVEEGGGITAWPSMGEPIGWCGFGVMAIGLSVDVASIRGGASSHGRGWCAVRTAMRSVLLVECGLPFEWKDVGVFGPGLWLGIRRFAIGDPSGEGGAPSNPTSLGLTGACCCTGQSMTRDAVCGDNTPVEDGPIDKATQSLRDCCKAT